MTYEEAKELAINEAKTNKYDAYVYILNVGEEYDIAHDLMEFMMKNMWGYKVIERVKCQNQENCEETKGGHEQ